MMAWTIVRMMSVRFGEVGTGSVPVTPSHEIVVPEVGAPVVDVVEFWAWADVMPIPHSKTMRTSFALNLFFIEVSFAARCALRGD